jgi:hypothetical protein
MNRIGELMMQHLCENLDSWARGPMIEIGIPEDTVDLYIEKGRRELKDARLHLALNALLSSYTFC